MELTTLLILADIVESAKSLSSIFLLVGGLAFVFLVSMWGMNSSDLSRYTSEKDLDRYASEIAERKRCIEISSGLLKVLTPLMILATLLTMTLPSKRTLYIVAGLKAADGVINSEIGKKTQELLFKKIESYLDDTEKETTK
jgi:hypothetical protein